MANKSAGPRTGRPVQIRKDGFAGDVAYLTRLRTAIHLDAGFPRDEKAQTLRQIDELMESLTRLHHERIDQTSA